MQQLSGWIHAARLRTLPLALSSILMGGFLAIINGSVNYLAFILAIIVTTLLQILSNFANDYGDFTSGVDVEGRIGPSRALQSGRITQSQMKKGIVITSIFTFILGLLLLLVSNLSMRGFITFLIIGIIAIIAAITYTMGKRPYGYRGLGDLAVFIFFGIIGVLGSLWVIHGEVHPQDILMATTSGLFSVGVLNLNNMRDLQADKIHGKNTIPVLIGLRNARLYHILLIGGGWIAALIYNGTSANHWKQWLFLITLPLFLLHLKNIFRNEGADLDPFLKQLALSTFLFVLLFGLGWLI